jgi:hypothetical protein
VRTPELGREVVIVGWELTGLDHKDVRLKACRSRRGFGPDGGAAAAAASSRSRVTSRVMAPATRLEDF